MSVNVSPAGLEAKRNAIVERALDWWDCNRRELPWRAGPGETPEPYRVWPTGGPGRRQYRPDSGPFAGRRPTRRPGGSGNPGRCARIGAEPARWRLRPGPDGHRRRYLQAAQPRMRLLPAERGLRRPTLRR